MAKNPSFIILSFNYEDAIRQDDNDDKNEYFAEHYNVALLRSDLMCFLNSGFSQ